MKYDPIEQARLIYEAQPTAYNASAYQVAMQLAALKAELEQDQKQLQAEIKAAKTYLAYAKRMADNDVTTAVVVGYSAYKAGEAFGDAISSASDDTDSSSSD